MQRWEQAQLQVPPALLESLLQAHPVVLAQLLSLVVPTHFIITTESVNVRNSLTVSDTTYFAAR
jgi:hypothetical protein